MFPRLHGEKAQKFQCALQDAASEETRALFTNTLVHVKNAVDNLKPIPTITQKMYPHYLEIKLPSNDVCYETLTKLVVRLRATFKTLSFDLERNSTEIALIVAQAPPMFRSSFCWRFLFFLVCVALVCIYFVAFDRLTFL